MFVVGSKFVPGRDRVGSSSSSLSLSLSLSLSSAWISTKVSSIRIASESVWPLKETRGFLIRPYTLNSVATSPATEANGQQDFIKILLPICLSYRS